jgi:hypothetical protein
MLKIFNKRGQNIAEYSILIALVIAAAVGMQLFVKRGIQGRVADVVDYHPNATILDNNPNATVSIEDLQFKTNQYEPYYTDTSANVSSSRTYEDTLASRGGVTRKDIVENTTRAKDSYEAYKWNNTTSR